MVSESTKRLFFGLEVASRWHDEWPQGRLLEETDRHMTLVFLGNVPFDPLEKSLKGLPLPPFKVGPVGYFDKSLFLPPRRPRVVAWQVHLFDERVSAYQSQLADGLREKGYAIEQRPFLPHVTLARSPFVIKEWKKAFHPTPCTFTRLNLYESLGNLRYRPIWEHPLIAPITEIEHTADLAFLLRGQNMAELQRAATVALSFECPDILDYAKDITPRDTLEDLIIELNACVTQVDKEVGCPFKAVSFHGEIKEVDGVLEWEMIVDV